MARPEIHVFRVDRDRIDRSDPLPLEAVSVHEEGAGLPYCLIFRPRGLHVAPGDRFWVEVTGLERRRGAPARLQYLVEFIP